MKQEIITIGLCEVIVRLLGLNILLFGLSIPIMIIHDWFLHKPNVFVVCFFIELSIICISLGTYMLIHRRKRKPDVT